MKVAVDRIEEGIAVLILQDDLFFRINLPVPLLPPGCREGDILTLTLEADAGETGTAKTRVTGLVNTLKKKR